MVGQLWAVDALLAAGADPDCRTVERIGVKECLPLDIAIWFWVQFNLPDDRDREVWLRGMDEIGLAQGATQHILIMQRLLDAGAAVSSYHWARFREALDSNSAGKAIFLATAPAP
eukprot:1985536-Prymnesium_polylepis.1